MTKTLVLIHAFPMGAGMWRAQRDAVPGWQVVTPSLPGFDGRPLGNADTIDAYADAVVATLDREGIDTAVIGGLSMGGYVTFGLLRRAPERIAGLILADTRTSGDTPERQAARHRSIELARTKGPSAIADEMIPAILGPTTHATRPEVLADVRRLIESQPAETIARALQAMLARPDSTDVLSRVNVPTLIVVGEEDLITTVDDAEFMHQRILGSTVTRIPRAGHMSNMEAPEMFNAAVRLFLRGLEE